MKELRLLVRVRNNLLRERRLAAGLTAEQLAKKARVSHQGYGRLECMRDSPRLAGGNWRKIARRLARYHRCRVGDLFPEGVLAVRQPVAERRVDVSELGPLLEDSRGVRRLLPPGARVRGSSVRKVLAEVVGESDGISERTSHEEDD